ncbi:MAG: CvpA family protein [Sphingomonas fennica]
MTALDIVTLLLVGGAAVLGVLRGFVTEVLSLLAWAGAIAALKLFHAPATDLLDGVVGTRGAAAVLAFTLLFIVTYAAGKLIAHSVGRHTRQSILGPVDRFLGLGFGALKGLLAATLLLLLASLGYDTLYGGASARPEWMTQSRSYPLLNAGGRAILDFVDRRRREGGTAAASPQ